MGITRNCLLGAGVGAGALLTLLGSCFVVYWPDIFDAVLNKELALSEDSRSFGLWEVTPIPLYIEFYFFNWTNEQDLKTPGTKPIFEELGPYVFREHRRKVIHAWNHNNETVTFRQNRTWEFDPSLSKGTLDDNVTTINIPAVAAAFSCRHCGGFTKFMLNEAINALGTRLYVTKKVREFLFEGYTDPLLDLAQLIPKGLAPVSIPFDKFGWFYTRNGSADYDGIFNMRTGVRDIQNLGVLANWDYRSQTPFYESYCGRVNGSAGEFFPPNRDKTKISLFSPDICRTLDLNYKEEIQVNGINGYRYWGDDKMFANQTQCPDNWCWCPAGECPPHGALDVSTCKWGAPAFISFPHFYHADQSYRDAVVGMHPVEEKHQMFIDLEPRSGIPLQVAASFQINILLQPTKEYTLLHDVPKIYFPTVWFKQTARIDDKIGPELAILTALPGAGTIISFVVLSLGVTCLLVIAIFYLTRRCFKDDETFHGLPVTYPFTKNLGYRHKDVCCAIRNKLSGRVQPSSIVTISNGSRIPHFAIPINNNLPEIISNATRRGVSPVRFQCDNDDEERSPLYS
ncbi:unnamed protein product [Allacma fusca]|uniref:Protein croquemort n=1 Tax=Allacma fusca TaxID=39272 RepID=A0A8J2PIW3_9HEXA|nr:unnamed protein product [Allacma fusca]